MVYQRKYDWTIFAGVSVSAQTVGETLERIEAEHGEVSKELFLDVSRPDDSPTHALFEWNDEKAAEKYRLQQSGRYIRDLKVTVIRQESKTKEMSVELKNEPWKGPAYMNAGEKRIGAVRYSNVYDALRDDKKRNNMLQNAKSELSIFRRKYDKLNELSGVFREVDKLIGGNE